jgi:hypothetical protein
LEAGDRACRAGAVHDRNLSRLCPRIGHFLVSLSTKTTLA